MSESQRVDEIVEMPNHRHEFFINGARHIGSKRLGIVFDVNGKCPHRFSGFCELVRKGCHADICPVIKALEASSCAKIIEVKEINEIIEDLK